MPGIKIRGFSGLEPRTSAFLLQDSQAQIADDVKLYAGELRAWRVPAPVDAAIVPVAKTVFRLTTGNLSAWLSWATDVDVVRSPIADVSDGRVYYTGDGYPKKTNYALATSAAAPYPVSFYRLGVVAPVSAPSVSSSGGSGGVESRVYLYTYISTFGALKEESAPSPTASVDSQVLGATVSITGLPATAPAGNYNITHLRIYRAVVGGSTVDYRFVVELPIGMTTYSDTFNSSTIAGNDPLTSLFYLPPPDDLQGLVLMPNGFLAGFRDNEVWFSEPSLPHAFNPNNVLTVEHQIVALGVTGGTLVVMTEQYPVLMTGLTPDSIAQEKVTLAEPCVSKRSVASDDQAVLYASPNGVVAIGPGIRGVITAKLFRRDEWQRYNPITMIGEIYDGKYFAFYEASALDRKALVISRDDTPALTTYNYFAAALYADIQTAAMYAVDAGTNKLQQIDGGEVAGSYRWRSKKFDLAFPTNLGCLQVYADYASVGGAVVNADQVVTDNAAKIAAGTVFGSFNDYAFNERAFNADALVNPSGYAAAGFATITVWLDGMLQGSINVEDEKIYKLPSGRRGRSYELEAIGNINIFSISIGSTPTDLKQV